ncbi:MAG: hypothetical protein ABIB79_02995 [archaeon]
MTKDLFHEGKLERLFNGKEIEWDSVVMSVQEDLINRDEAISSLRACLAIKIPEYKEMLKTTLLGT